MSSAPQNGGGFTVKEIVVDIRDTLKALADKVDRIDRQGSIGTKAILEDHESRMRDNTRRVTTLEDTQVTRADLHEVKASIAALSLTLADRPEQIRQFRDSQNKIEELEGEINNLKMWRAWTKGSVGLVAFSMPVLATISWHLWG